MRYLIVATAFAAVVGPATSQGQQGQIKVELKQRLADSVRVLRERPVTKEQARRLWAEVDALITQNMRDHELWMRELKSSAPDQKRITSLMSEMEQNVWVLLPKQSEFATMCAMLRRQEGDTPGTLGLQLDDSVHWVFDPRLGTLTVVVSAPRKIAAVAAGSPAEKSGVQVGDVLTAINGRPFIDSVRFDELLTPGSTVTARVQRDGKEFAAKPMIVVRRVSDYPAECSNAKQIDISTPFFRPGSGYVATPMRKPLDRLPMTPSTSGGPGGPQVFLFRTSTTVYGASLQPLDDEWRRTFAVQDGVGVIEVADGSPAQSAGLRKFDVVTQINGVAVVSPAAFLRAATEQRNLTLTVFNKISGVHTITLSRP